MTMLVLLIALQLSIRAFTDSGISQDIAMIDVVDAKIRGGDETQVIPRAQEACNLVVVGA